MRAGSCAECDLAQPLRGANNVAVRSATSEASPWPISVVGTLKP
jgi:hypothetical protein